MKVMKANFLLEIKATDTTTAATVSAFPRLLLLSDQANERGLKLTMIKIMKVAKAVFTLTFHFIITKLVCIDHVSLFN